MAGLGLPYFQDQPSHLLVLTWHSGNRGMPGLSSSSKRSPLTPLLVLMTMFLFYQLCLSWPENPFPFPVSMRATSDLRAIYFFSGLKSIPVFQTRQNQRNVRALHKYSLWPKVINFSIYLVLRGGKWEPLEWLPGSFPSSKKHIQ